jgi:hypothetical protein
LSDRVTVPCFRVTRIEAGAPMLNPFPVTVRVCTDTGWVAPGSACLPRRVR